jgi:DNA topoisomerase-3
MDRHGIGTDATMTEHIETIQKRKFAVKGPDSRFRPTELGFNLVEAYEALGLGLAGPVLRARMERIMQDVAEGRTSRQEAVDTTLREMLQILERLQHQK